MRSKRVVKVSGSLGHGAMKILVRNLYIVRLYSLSVCSYDSQHRLLNVGVLSADNKRGLHRIKFTTNKLSKETRYIELSIGVPVLSALKDNLGIVVSNSSRNATLVKFIPELSGRGDFGNVVVLRFVVGRFKTIKYIEYYRR